MPNDAPFWTHEVRIGFLFTLAIVLVIAGVAFALGRRSVSATGGKRE